MSPIAFAFTLILLRIEIGVYTFASTIEIRPLDWRCGIHLRVPDKNEGFPLWDIEIQVPTLYLSVGWINLNRMTAVPVQAEESPS